MNNPYKQMNIFFPFQKPYHIRALKFKMQSIKMINVWDKNAAHQQTIEYAFRALLWKSWNIWRKRKVHLEWWSKKRCFAIICALYTKVQNREKGNDYWPIAQMCVCVWLCLSSKCILSSVRVWRFWGWWDGPFPFRKVIEPFGLQHQPFNLLPDSSTAINEKLSSTHHSPPPTPKASAQRYKCTLCTLCKCQAVQCLYGMIDLFHV